MLDLVSLRFADERFSAAQKELAPQSGAAPSRRTIGKPDCQARGILYLLEKGRYSNLLELPEGADFGEAVSNAMVAIEDENEELGGVLPKDYSKLDYRLECI